jgi:hypothetical protein
MIRAFSRLRTIGLRAVLVMMILSVQASSAEAGIGDLAEPKVNAEIEKHARDVHGVAISAFSGGGTVLLKDPMAKKTERFEIGCHAKIKAENGSTGDATLAYDSWEKGAAEDSISVRGSMLFALNRGAPATPEEADALFDGMFGEGARGGVYGARSFAPGDNGEWMLYGEYHHAGEDAFVVKGFVSIGPDDDDPSLLVISFFSEVQPGAGH